MAFLLPTELTLHGGCLCSAIRYTISIPSATARPLVPAGALPTPTAGRRCADPARSVPTTLPLIDIDHCNDCRRACGGLVQCWLICPQEWVQFRLQPRRADGDDDATPSGIGGFGNDDAAAVTRSCGEVADPTPALRSSSYLASFASSAEVRRVFCGRCGTGVTYTFVGERGPAWTLGPIVDIAMGTLDRESLEADGVRPDRHGWWDSGVTWIRQLLTSGDVRDGWQGGLIRHPTGRVTQAAEEEI